MSEAADTIVHCPGCGVAMDVSELAPFTKVVCPHCGESTRVKRVFGPYALVRRHAVGGMSMVFVAHDATLDREVALKILNEKYSADERRIAAFEEEARITASLSHPNVVRVFKTGRAFGRFYIAMELVPGGHLEHQIHERGKIPELEVLPLAIEVAQGLKAAHAAGLIHRDVKPGNILLDAAGHAKLVDFGLALVTQGGKATATELWATPYYVPPETVEGQAEDFRSDIYAFGATWYHALSGKPPCGEESMATDRLREAKKSVMPLALVEPTLSGATCRIMQRAMAYSPAGRHASYDELITDLTIALAALKSGTATPTAKADAGKRRGRTHPMVWLAPAMVMVAAALTWLWYPRQQKEKPAVEPAVSQAAEEVPPEAGDAEHAAEISRSYHEASKALEAGDFKLAETGFKALFANPQVHEPTRSWAGLQAILAAMLDARMEDAVRQLDPMREHLRGLPADHPLSGGDWEALLDQMKSAQPLAPVEAHSAAGVIANMLAGLGNWNRGRLANAAACLRAVRAVKLPHNQAWAAIYQKLAAAYMEDHKVLTGPLFRADPENAAECLAMLDRLDEAMALMKTRGRARSSVRERRDELLRRAREFETAARQTTTPAPVKSTDEELWKRTKELVGEWRFAEATACLMELPEWPPQSSRDAWIFMTRSAASFINDIARDLAAEPFTGELQTADGRAAKHIVIDDAENLRLTLANGETLNCTWSDLSPDAMITLHRALVRKPLSETERLRRHERAIAFDWLVGNRTRALAAVANISQTNNAFKQHWESILQNLGE